MLIEDEITEDYMKTIAMYLPQFHRVPENDEWWGEGFTEWTAVKQAKPMFDGHNQPKEPLNDYYYDLAEKDVMKWQADLIRKYKVHGMCFYHYWFKDGRKILEKPAENLLGWKDIHMQFCFSWANESWARTWSGITLKNTWSNKFDNTVKVDENDNGILLEQKYGREKEWKEHFTYLLQFFKDERYIKTDNKPIFLFYKPMQIKCLDDMLEKWNEWAKIEGFNGIYSIMTSWEEVDCRNVDAYLIHEPSHTVAVFGNSLFSEDADTKFSVKQYSYDKMWQALLKQNYNLKKKTYFGGFVNYDDTPRHSHKGLHTAQVTPDKFKKYFEQLVVKSVQDNNEYVFLNAWNEWGEGMYLEPDKENGYNFLNAICEVIEKYDGIKVENIHGDRQSQMTIAVLEESEQVDIEYYKNCLNTKDKNLKKIKNYFDLLNQWMYLKDIGKTIESFFKNRGYNNIAIYGIGHLGKHLYSDLVDTSVNILYIIDKGVNSWSADITMKTLSDTFDLVDAIIVTPIDEFLSIKRVLREKVDFPIISLEEVIWET